MDMGSWGGAEVMRMESRRDGVKPYEKDPRELFCPSHWVDTVKAATWIKVLTKH